MFLFKSKIKICKNLYKVFWGGWWGWGWIPHSLYNQNSCDFSFICATDGRKCTIIPREPNYSVLVEEKYFDFSGICLPGESQFRSWVRQPVIKWFGFLTTDAIKSRTTLWIQFYLKYMSEGLRNFKVHVLMDLHQIILVSLPQRCVCNFSLNGQSYNEVTLESNLKNLLSTLKPCLTNWCWKCWCTVDKI